MAQERVQLVFQLPQDFFAEFEELVAFEDRLMQSMSKNAVVDGHDIGSGTVNFFVFTQFPEAAFQRFRKYQGTLRIERKLRVAYRPLNPASAAWVELWPKRPKRNQPPFDYFY